MQEYVAEAPAVQFSSTFLHSAAHNISRACYRQVLILGWPCLPTVKPPVAAVAPHRVVTGSPGANRFGNSRCSVLLRGCARRAYLDSSSS